ncbi:Glucan endo-1,6-beta-glucosidase [Hymenobacter roseosalivarius DSM 11622]|uniref:Glucan endo-1,6-beta-glucosidase n=1 Tax=Hymenobacter roseosalivarius DSM 11622 TaxID=645990 RepID=A0A1W1VVZ3_9BACT|nr:glycoside hydrolase family 30 beta sandwich domain-containing protein [Hymenobacter roseosalivarius]SMB97281.1 Glucan endo-1,6-beta-glucosidase [Hymenobacter roseosalivarius DSM 11622]
MRSSLTLILLSAGLLAFAVGCGVLSGSKSGRASTGLVQVWLTNPAQAERFAVQPSLRSGAIITADVPIIAIDEQQRFQTMDGFGYTLTGGSAMLLHKMTPEARAKLLRELFGVKDDAIGISYLRLSIGASDLDDRVFSYNDLPLGETDPTLARFSLAPDQEHLIPVLKEILAVSPDIKLLGSPWSPPTWMKTNANSKGGSLKPEWYDAYARYFVKYVQGYAAEGIRIDAITVQNEPLHPGNNPSLLMLAEQQATFIKSNLGPAFKAAKLDTKIIIYDHNADKPEYPITVLNDPEARAYIDGSAFHLYGGQIEALSKVHAAYPDKHLYFTEQWVGSKTKFADNFSWHIKNLVIGAPRNWARTVLEWNLAADSQQNPHTPGGCTECRGAITIDGDSVKREDAYYIIAHASKFVQPGSVRVASTETTGLPNVAFRTPDGQLVIIVQNEGTEPKTFGIRRGQQTVTATLPPGAAATYVW